MAVPGKRLFWIAIIIVELVFVYVLWRPVRDHLKPSRRAAVTHPAVTKPEIRQPEAHQPEVRQSEVHQPEVHQPQARQPEARQPVQQHAQLQRPQLPHFESKSPPVRIAPQKPSGAIARSAPPARKRIVISAGLKTPEPIPAQPTVVPPPAAGPLDSFWCRISKVDTTCDCKAKDGDQTANLVMK
jgi:hypothetical protein